MILDTDFLIALEDGPDATAKARRLEARTVPLRVPTVVVKELYVAVGLGSNSFENARKFEALVENKPVVASTALQFNEPVVTGDVSDFGSVDGLDVVVP
jgi:predicted nucleic acid-binding protein